MHGSCFTVNTRIKIIPEELSIEDHDPNCTRVIVSLYMNWTKNSVARSYLDKRMIESEETLWDNQVLALEAYLPV